LIVNDFGFAGKRFAIEKRPTVAAMSLHRETPKTFASNPNWCTVWRLVCVFLPRFAMRSTHNSKYPPDFTYLQMLKYQVPNQCALSSRKSLRGMSFWDTAIPARGRSVQTGRTENKSGI
jgi:hypothetical protein